MSIVHAVTDRAIDAIKQMIIDGSLAPGDRLPPEKELAERVGVSRNSLREAVKALSVIRVLDVRRGMAPTSPPWRTSSTDRKSTRLNSSHVAISYAVFCLKKKNKYENA